MKHRIYYISQGATSQQHVQNILHVCEKYADSSQYDLSYVQLRLKNVSYNEFLNIAQEALAICARFKTDLIINDNVSVAEEINCAGIHVGKNDDTPTAIRKTIDKTKIIGGTANTLEDCLYLIEQGVDYIGLGPFQYTKTKKVLSPILGFDGCKSILKELKKRKHSIPIYAIGGIELEDVGKLIEIGFQGAAISSALTKKSFSKIEDAPTTIKNQHSI